MEVWENEKCCGNTSRRRVFPQLFRVLPNFHECFYNSIETRYMFSISFRKHRDEKKENNLLTLIIKMKILFARAIITSTAHASSVSPSNYTNTMFNQSARVFPYDCFLSYYKILSNNTCSLCSLSKRDKDKEWQLFVKRVTFCYLHMNMIVKCNVAENLHNFLLKMRTII